MPITIVCIVFESYLLHVNAGGTLLCSLRLETLKPYRENFGVNPEDRTRHPLFVRRKR